MRIAALVLAAAVSGFVPVLAHAQDDNSQQDNATQPKVVNAYPAHPDVMIPNIDTKDFTPQQRAVIEDIIKNYITQAHPEVLIAASQELQKREQTEAKVKTDEAIQKNKDRIFDDPNTPVGGNPKGDVTIVEFFDYNCGYCKLSEDGIEKILKEDKGVKFVYKDFPVLGDESTLAAHASFAAIKQGKYVAFHDALMNKKDHLSDDVIFQAAKSAGLDIDKLKKDMADPAIDKLIQDNIKLGMDIGVRGTPMFIINEKIFPGSMQYPQLVKNVQEARAAEGTKKP